MMGLRWLATALLLADCPSMSPRKQACITAEVDMTTMRAVFDIRITV
jgi:hypothetical protein